MSLIEHNSAHSSAGDLIDLFGISLHKSLTDIFQIEVDGVENLIPECKEFDFWNDLLSQSFHKSIDPIHQEIQIKSALDFQSAEFDLQLNGLRAPPYMVITLFM